MFSIRTEIDVKDCGEGNTRPGTQHIQSAGVLWEPKVVQNTLCIEYTKGLAKQEGEGKQRDYQGMWISS